MASKFLTLQSTSWPLVLGLDIGIDSVKYLLLKRQGSKLSVQKFGRVTIRHSDMDIHDVILEVIDRIFPKKQYANKIKIVIGLDGKNVVIKKESLPPLTAKELQQTVRFAVQQALDKEGDDFNFTSSYLKLGPDAKDENNTIILSMGIDNIAINEILQPFYVKEILPTKVTTHIVSLGNLMGFIPKALHSNIGVLDIGTYQSMLTFFRKGKLDFYREIIVGGNDFTKAVNGTVFHEGKAIQFNLEEATEFKMKFGYPVGFSDGMTFMGAPLSEIAAMMRPVLERLTSEIHRSFDFYKEKSDVEEIDSLYLIGGGARLKHFSEILADKLNIPVLPFPYPKGLKIVGTQVQKEAFKKKYLEHVSSLATAMESGLDGNLLPEKIHTIQTMAAVKRAVNYVAVGMVCIILLLSMTLKGQLNSIKSRVVSLNQRLASSHNNGQIFATLVGERETLDNKIRELDVKLSTDDQIIQVLRLISHEVPEKLSLISLEYGNETDILKQNIRNDEDNVESQKILYIRGFSQHPANDVRVNVAEFILRLKQSNYFSQVELIDEKENDEILEYGFELVGTLING